ncbi:hypothetical protein F5890DRAFT_1654554 [Lentinula detonsa]|uniref:Uncharacterized protein n=1 Tax=Lentinula detonsa TaxID=2804962 RepID=A0AA38UT03_9AGAR|nr:hypothetical protein F5890DRAFT_1654554 [Lentinula detonsa]
MFLMRALYTAVWSTSLLWQVRCNDPTLNVPACSSQFDYQWSVNSKAQSPCQVAGYLGSVCSGGVFAIPAVIPGSQPYSLSLGLQNNCTCSTVYYSALSACASCQGVAYSTQVDPLWAEWSTNCSTVFLGLYPYAIPSGTAVPHWAYQAITGSASFNATIAQQAGGKSHYLFSLFTPSNNELISFLDLPESSAAAASTASSTSTSASKTSTTVSSTASSDDTTHKINAGAIAGGVVGGLAFLCMIILVIIFVRPCSRRKKGDVRTGTAPLSDDDMSLVMPIPFTLHHPTSTPLKPNDTSDPNIHPSSESITDSRHMREHYLSWSGTSRYSGLAEI